MKIKVTQVQHGADPVLTRAVNEDKVPWYKKPNLRYLYLFLFPTCMGIEITRYVNLGEGGLAGSCEVFSEAAPNDTTCCSCSCFPSKPEAACAPRRRLECADADIITAASTAK